MQMKDFDLVERGPALFDTYANRIPVSSPIGDFRIELTVGIGAQPTPAMFAAADRLSAKFSTDREMLALKVHDRYLAVCMAGYGPDWLKQCGVPEGLSLPQLCEYLDPRTLTVDRELNMSVYVSPDWDREHGLYFDLVDGEWQLGD